MKFHPGEALTVYAVSGLILLPFYKVRKQVNLWDWGFSLTCMWYFSL